MEVVYCHTMKKHAVLLVTTNVSLDESVRHHAIPILFDFLSTQYKMNIFRHQKNL